MERFAQRVARLPRLGVGVSTEHGASRSGTHPVRLRDAHPGLVEFLEIGADVDRGVDDDSAAWVARGWPTTYHFLDLNLEEPEDLDQDWLDATVALARGVRAAWLCGDAGLWHVGPRDRGHGTLLPPILCASSVASMVDAVVALRERSGFEVLPENPPAHVLVGDLHPLEYFGRVADRADCGLLLDVAHLAIVQRALGLGPTALLDAFPVERVVEVHVAGGSEFRSAARVLIHDDHGPVVHDDTWRILEEVLRRATALRAVVVECERNPPEVVVGLFERVRALVGDAPGFRGPPVEPPPVVVPEVRGPPVDHREVQRTLFRMLLDPRFADRVRADPPVPEPAATWLRSLDPALLAADPDQGRVRQLLGNVATELLHTVRAAPPFLDGFPSSPELHRALAEDRPLVLALAAYADRVLPPGPWRAVLRLDTAMAEVRRARANELRSPEGEDQELRSPEGEDSDPIGAEQDDVGSSGPETTAQRPPLPEGEGRGEGPVSRAQPDRRAPPPPGGRGPIPQPGMRGPTALHGPAGGGGRALSPLAQVLELPEGAVAAAGALREGAALPPHGPGVEQVVVVNGPAGVQVEVVGDAIAELLRAGPLDDAALDAFAARHDATREEVDALVEGLVSDGILA